MRTCCAISVVICCLLTASFGYADEFPYSAYVNAENVYVRSGPGKNYYPTDKLQRGTEVEVHRHDPGGWYAVRPTVDSFSWVAGRHLSLLEDNLAEVTEKEVTAYVGSKFSDVHDVRQVSLDQGELVEIVGEKRFVSPNASTAETWFKIAPPRGEFRWVYGRFVVRQGIASTKAEHVEPEAPTRQHNRWSKSRLSGGRAHHHPEPRDVARDGTVDEDANERVSIPKNAFENDGDHHVQLTSAERAIDFDDDAHASRLTGNNTRGLKAIEQINMDLSLLVAEPAADWDFDSLRIRAQAAEQHAASALERGKAKHLLREIERYERLKQDYAHIDEIRAQTDEQNRLVEIASTAVADLAEPEVKKASHDVTQFDGVGLLRTVVSRRPGAPQFALTNESGQVLMFVAPATGIDMQPYIGKVVGLTGTRGYMPHLKKSHLTAARVEALDRSAMVALRNQR